ncbi:LuxR C-terminal-related transcriptional regulator [Streptomyces sp. NBC_00340]|uniref:helix-turn-helix domain-containing protein n=1 Tax=Streptomyces sp. NBC_00340 TaxID=2975716 RepID=UPI002254276C|nr:LuxR C-terminal-related transcriptional regulator [Streptomyces sp. NBC_00340]MCX5137614.1 LuxR C-terminal-related transcriptional regulator [Streptomyces sp. NBC_00340]
MRALTAQQRRVLALVANGFTNADIGARLGLSSRTINRHLADVYDRLGVDDRAQAVAVALVLGELGRLDVQLPTGGPRPAIGRGRRQEPASGPQGAPEPARGGRDVRGTARAAEGRVAARGEAAA